MKLHIYIYNHKYIKSLTNLIIYVHNWISFCFLVFPICIQKYHNNIAENCITFADILHIENSLE